MRKIKLRAVRMVSATAVVTVFIILIILCNNIMYPSHSWIASSSGVNKTTIGRENAASERCSYPFHVFIYPLPTIFNAQLIPFVHRLGENAAGFRTDPAFRGPVIFDGTVNLLQYTTEILLHWLLTKHPCVTSDPEKASFFYFPVYTYYRHVFTDRGRSGKDLSKPLHLLDQMLRNSSHTDAFFRYADEQAILDKRLISQFYSKSATELRSIGQLYQNAPTINSSKPYPLPLDRTHTLPSVFKSYLYRNRLCDHIFVASRAFMEWDGPYLWQARDGPQHNIIWLGIEMPSRYPLDRYKEPKLTKNIAIPYVVSGVLHRAGDRIYRELTKRLAAFGMSTEHVEPCQIFCSDSFSMPWAHEHLQRSSNNSADRPLLSYFAGSTINIRGHLKDLMSTMRASVFEVVDHSNKKINGQLIIGYLTSTFCFVLPGDGKASKRLFDVISGNCIPVIISENWELPFAYLPWSTFSLRFSTTDIIHNKSMIRTALMTMPAKQILGMQINLYKNRHHFLYALDTDDYVSQPGDVLDNIFQELNARQQYAKTCQFYG